MLTTGRGWCVFELAFAELMQSNLQTIGGNLANVYLPLFLVPQTHPELPRSVWQAVRDRGRFYDPGTGTDRASWATAEIMEYIRREQALAANMAKALRQDKPLRTRLQETPGLVPRITRPDPCPLPPAG